MRRTWLRQHATKPLPSFYLCHCPVWNPPQPSPLGSSHPCSSPLLPPLGLLTTDCWQLCKLTLTHSHCHLLDAICSPTLSAKQVFVLPSGFNRSIYLNGNLSFTLQPPSLSPQRRIWVRLLLSNTAHSCNRNTYIFDVFDDHLSFTYVRFWIVWEQRFFISVLRYLVES